MKNVVVVPPNDKLGITVTDFDYGYWTKDKDGKTVHKPISEVPGAQKVHMLLNMTFTTGMQKQNLSVDKDAFIQIIPSVNPLTLRKGDTYEIKCLKTVNHMQMQPLIKDVIK